MDQRDIDAAKQAGILDESKAAELTAFFKDRRLPNTGDVTEEQTLRFLSNFNDIFISIGLVILSIGVMMASGALLGGSGNAFVILAPILVVMWLLLEYFAGRRRLVLPLSLIHI